MKKKFLTEMNFEITNQDLFFVRNIYQPIIGLEAVSLYQLLIDYNYFAKYRRTFFLFKDIINVLCIDILTFEQSRNKLEAIGLLRTFERADGLHFIFKINKPLELKKFHKNHLLFKQVISKIGEEGFERVVFSTNGDHLNKDDYQEITIKYYDLFNLDENINFNTTLEIQLPNLQNKNDAIKSLTTPQFVHYITNKKIVPSLLTFIYDLQKLGFSSTSLNIIMDYSYEINGRIVNNYIKKIAYDLYEKKITNAKEVEEELLAAKRFKKHTSSSLNLDSLTQNENKDEKTYNWKKVFDSLGEF